MAGDSLELVLSDAHGTKIHASCKKTYMDELATKVPVGEWINIDNFSLTNAPRTFRTTKNPLKMNFLHNTDISESTLRIDDNFLDLVDFETILTGKHNTNILIDLIGQVLDLGDLDTVHCTGGKERKNDLRLPCCLWGTYAENVYNACQEAEDGFIVCLLRFAKIGHFRGEVQISNAYDSSKIFINPDIQEAQAFRKIDSGDSLAITISDSGDNKLDKKLVSHKWMQCQEKNLAELVESTEVEPCRVIATICDIDTDWGWYLFGCFDCNKKVFQESKTVKRVNGKDVLKYVWWCETCQKLVYSVKPQFKIHLMVKDDTGESSFMLLDSIAKVIVPQSAEYLLNGSLDELEEDADFPDAITTLIGQTFTFGVYVEKDNSSAEGVCYKVGKVWKDLKLLKIGDNSESGSAPSSSFVSEAPLLLQDNEPNEAASTPSKRKNEENKDTPDKTSTSKKLCTKVIKKEKK
ncbi:replication protein A 70 kDa DNA-binding subunit B-like [Brassica napus]|uniref:replication protein A 70 kDa DNA-binding subunit B-like n=1 Tax=Brassica napus TaxID=3708 RepID=UPI00207A07DE|nr:replication protein A 70 kDa DNA-binding subunit B-like [Brassica napus]